MNKYKITYKLSNGFEGEEIIYAANRTMAQEIFAKYECFKGCIAVSCLLILDKEDY